MLQIQTIKPECLALLKEVMYLDELKHFQLAGGTALSLYLGHRISIDLDLFTNQLFDVKEFTTFLTGHFKDRIIIKGSNKYGVFAVIDQVKVDFLYRYEKFLNPYEEFDRIRLSSLEDIGVMKINATFSRSSKKDYYDLYELLNVFTFADLIELHKKMYPNYALAGVLKSLADFHEVELDSEPVIILKEVDWVTIKELISKNIKDYVSSLQQRKSDAENERQKRIEGIINKKKDK